MASIHKEVLLDVPVERVWAALRDEGNAHHPFAGVLTDAKLDGDMRTVTFANGMVPEGEGLDASHSGSPSPSGRGGWGVRENSLLSDVFENRAP